MDDLKDSREKISQIDEQMVKLFEERMKVAADVAAFKKERGLPIKDAEREAHLIKINAEKIGNKEIEEYYVSFQKNLMELSCKYQARLNEGMKVAYSGVEGAFGYIAAKKLFPDANLIAFANFDDAYKAVEKGEMDAAVLPVENSYAGEVENVMDLMFSGSLYVNKLMDFDIVQNLLSVKGATPDSIKTVISHPQALFQCDEFIKSHGYETEACSNTAVAAKLVQEKKDKTLAAVASDETAKLYGLEIIAPNINTAKNNTTRFAVFSRVKNEPVKAAKKADKHFIIMFTVKNQAGSLAQTLNIIGAHNFNMRNLRSRPMKNLMWKYYFYIEAEGDINTENGREMLQELSAVCANLKLVGSYN